MRFAAQNLLPDARGALDYFAAAGITWHDGVDGGPSNHLRDSQVQCVNALAPFMHRPDAVLVGCSAREFVVGNARAVRRRRSRPTSYVAFEWIGEGNPLGEWTHGVGTRGAKNTSADAAIRHVERGRAHSGLAHRVEVHRAVPRRPGELHTSSTSQATRDARYRPLYEDPDGPLRHDVIPYDDFFVEPVYQLFRLSLLAWRFEVAGVADCVRVLYCAPARNLELWASLNRESHREMGDGNLGDPLADGCRSVPIGSSVFDTAALVAPDAPTSAEFKARYGHMARN